MAPRPTFKGYLRLSLVTVPVKAFTATDSEETIRLNQLHAECNSRIRYQKVCPIHGEVSSDEIVKGFEYTKDSYVVIDPDEIASLRKESDKAVEIRGFVDEGTIDPLYHSGRTYYILPDGPVGQKPYQLLMQVMREKDLQALATAVIAGREQLMLIRPIGDLLGMSVLQYNAKLRDSAEFEEDLQSAEFSKEELALTETLIAASKIEELDFAAYEDEYTENLKQIIEAKVSGEEIVAAPAPEEPKVINLMEALKASVEAAQQPDAAPAKMAQSARKRSEAQKKTG